jgi:hypothetical protein
VLFLLQDVPSWQEVALAAVNVIQVVLLAWIAASVHEAKRTRDWRDRRDEEDRMIRDDPQR